MRRLSWSDDVGATVAELRALAPPAAEVQAAAAAIVADVRRRGDVAVRDQTARLDRVQLEDDYAVSPAELRARLAALSPELRAALETAAANIRAYHEREVVAPWRETLAQGQVVGQEVVPLAAAGLYVPGGLADYPSSVLMTAIPAQVAGVERIVVCSPPRPGGGAAAGVAAACALLGIEHLYPIGGAQAVAAMALGTARVPRCDVIVGPGNAYVTEAKRLLVGEVGIDSLAGPSEVLIIADETGEPEWLAADLLAQAEHGSGAMACLADVGGALAAPVAAAVERLSAELGIVTTGVVIVECPDRAAALALSNAFAPEHLELHCEDARDLLAGVRNAGAVFVGPHAATAFADYAAGTNHVLPTGGSARFGQGLSVDAFRKRVAVVELDGSAAAALAPQVAAIADEEGLRAHALSARLRPSEEPPMDERHMQSIEPGAGGAPLRARLAHVKRTTSETDIDLTLDLDGTGRADVVTGIGFLDHMLTLFAHHGGFDLTVRAGGDLHVDGHHTVEDIGLSLGRALREALGDKRGIRRYGSFLLPMDEALAQVALDLSGRPYFVHDLKLSGVRIGEFDADLTPHFLRSLSTESGMTLHVRLLAGSDVHHIVEAVFKAFARALSQACERHGRDDEVPSTKGTL